MKKVVVTGGSGFIGSNLLRFLIKKKFFVINIDKNKYLNRANKASFNKKNYIFFKIDINNRKRINFILDKYKPSAIFNLAAETHVDRSIDNPSTFIKSNVVGVFNLLESIRKYKKKNKLSAEFLGRGGAWLDSGSITNFYETSAFVSALEKRQGLKIACLEEIAFNNNWIKKDKILSAIKFYGNCSYSKYLNKILK